MSERFTAPQDDALYLQMCAEIEEKLRRAAPLYTRRYPMSAPCPPRGCATRRRKTTSGLPLSTPV